MFIDAICQGNWNINVEQQHEFNGLVPDYLLLFKLQRFTQLEQLRDLLRLPIPNTKKFQGSGILIITINYIVVKTWKILSIVPSDISSDTIFNYSEFHKIV